MLFQITAVPCFSWQPDPRGSLPLSRGGSVESLSGRTPSLASSDSKRMSADLSENAFAPAGNISYTQTHTHTHTHTCAYTHSLYTKHQMSLWNTHTQAHNHTLTPVCLLGMLRQPQGSRDVYVNTGKSFRRNFTILF